MNTFQSPSFSTSAFKTLVNIIFLVSLSNQVQAFTNTGSQNSGQASYYHGTCYINNSNSSSPSWPLWLGDLTIQECYDELSKRISITGINISERTSWGAHWYWKLNFSFQNISYPYTSAGIWRLLPDTKPDEPIILDSNTPIISPEQKMFGQPKQCIGNPCNPATGNKYQQETDYQGSTTGLSFIRHYNSGKHYIDSGLGYGWNHRQFSHLEKLGGQIIVHQGDGRAETFTLSNGTWQGDSDTHLVLTENSTGYTLITDQGKTGHYDLNGLILSQTDLVGREITYSYNASSQIATITGFYGHTLSFTYYANNRIATLTDPDAKVYHYQYDSEGNLSKVIYPDTTFKQYHYENSSIPHALTGITDANGDRFSSYSYDADGKAITTEHAITSNLTAQEHFDLNYDSDTQTTVTDATGTVEVLTFAENLGVKNLLSRINQTDNKGITRSYDATNNLISATDAEGKITEYSYNATNQRISITNAAGTTEQRTTQTQYLSSALDLPTLIVKPSIIDGQQARTRIQYNPGHTVQSITLSGYHPDSTAISRTTTFQYNTTGQVTQIDGPLATVNDRHT